MIPISRPLFDEADFAAVVEPLRRGWVVQGPAVREFEQAFSGYTGLARSVAVSSCTTALHVALEALGVGPGDEVIVPAFTWIATANAVRYTGARPVFVDIDLETFTLDVTQLEAAITPRTRAIVPVHLFGFAADLDAILAIARRHELRVVEDAACGFGTRWRGAHVGTFGDAGCFSFHPRKAITTGEGGMVTTTSEVLEARMRSLRDHGANRSSPGSHAFLLPDFDECGFNYRMTELQGALGVSQLRKADAMLAARRHLAARYDDHLDALPWMQRPVQRAHVDHSYQAYVCLFRPEAPTTDNTPQLSAMRNAIMAALDAQGIGTRQGTHSVPHTHYYRMSDPAAAEACPRSGMAEALTMALPLFPGMTDDDVATVVDALDGAFTLAAR